MLISFTLRYLGDSLEPDRITNSLGVSPTGCGQKGELISSQHGKDRILKKGHWEWAIKDDKDDSSQQRDSSGMLIQLDNMVEEFNVTFQKTMHLLNKQPNCEHSWIDIHIIDDECESVSFPLKNSSISILNKSGLLVDITVTQ